MYRVVSVMSGIFVFIRRFVLFLVYFSYYVATLHDVLAAAQITSDCTLSSLSPAFSYNIKSILSSHGLIPSSSDCSLLSVQWGALDDFDPTAGIYVTYNSSTACPNHTGLTITQKLIIPCMAAAASKGTPLYNTQQYIQQHYFHFFGSSGFSSTACENIIILADEDVSSCPTQCILSTPPASICNNNGICALDHVSNTARCFCTNEKSATSKLCTEDSTIMKYISGTTALEIIALILIISLVVIYLPFPTIFIYFAFCSSNLCCFNTIDCCICVLMVVFVQLLSLQIWRMLRRLHTEQASTFNSTTSSYSNLANNLRSSSSSRPSESIRNRDPRSNNAANLTKDEELVDL